MNLFYPNGQTKKLAEHVNNWTTTVNIKFYPDGKVQCDMNFKEGKKFGPYKEYYPNGQIYIWANYADGGVLDGVYKEYDEAGNVVKDCVYKNGKIE